VQFKYVIAFEPVAENFACLEQNADFKNVRRENVALGAETKTCSMVLPTRGNSGCWYAQPVDGPTAMRSIDSYALNDVDLIKIDVEGLEGHVLAGARETLARCLPTIVFEENGLGRLHYGAGWLDPAQLLTGWRYKRVGFYQKNEVWSPC
jgi:FkbM family methyltransferase